MTNEANFFFSFSQQSNQFYLHLLSVIPVKPNILADALFYNWNKMFYILMF